MGGVADPPHKVLKVTELMDANGILQGQPGYSNPIVCQGDVMYEINGERIGTSSHNGARKVTLCYSVVVYNCLVRACLCKTIHT